MNVLITGSRTIKDVDKVFEILDKELKPGDVVIHGGAMGADSLACAYSHQNPNKNLSLVMVPPIYPSKREYYLHRNAEMVGMSERVIALWDGVSRGTKFTINYAKMRNLDVKVYEVK